MSDQPRDERYLTLVQASRVRIRRPEWIYERRIPVGGVTLMAGREGESKTILACHLSARLTRGDLPGDRLGRPAHVVYIGVEDDLESVLIPRVIAAGADLDRFHTVGLPGSAPFTTTDVDALALALAELDELALVLVDPLDAHLGGSVDTHRKAEVQAAIGRLATLAQARRCAVLGLAHLNKGDSLDVLLKVVGSVGFTTSARSVLAVGQHPDNPNERIVVVRKANMTDATRVPAIRYRVEGVELPDPEGGQPIEAARAVILGEEEGIDANAILSIPNLEERTARTEAAEWLAEILGEGPQKARDIKSWAKGAEIAERTLQRARKDLGVIVERDEHVQGRPSSWRLPDSVPDVSSHVLYGTDGTKAETLLTEAFDATFEVPCHGANSGEGTEPALSTVAD